MRKALVVKSISIMGWGGGPSMTYGIWYSGTFEVEEVFEGKMLKFTVKRPSERSIVEKEELPVGHTFYVAQNTIREMVEA